MKRPRLRVAVLLGALSLCFGFAAAAYHLRMRDEVTVAAIYGRLRIGMTEADVGSAVPHPPGDYTGGYEHTTSRPISEGGLPIYLDYVTRPDGNATALDPSTGRPILGKWWRAKDGLVIVFFGDDHRITERRFYSGHSRSWVTYQVDCLIP